MIVPQRGREVTNRCVSGRSVEIAAIEGKSPVRENAVTSSQGT
jgi:hypothetical protein